MRTLIRVLLLLSACALPSLAQAQNPDPRDYEVGYFVPHKTTIINTYLRQVSATDGRDYAAQALALRATYILKFGDVVVTPFDLILPVQNVNAYVPVAALARVDPSFGMVPSDFKLTTHASGFGDLTFLPTIGHGITENAENHTHTWWALTAYVTAPSGRYNPNRTLNIGANRWIINPLITVGQRFARAFTVEIMGNAAFYTSNDEYRVATVPGANLKLNQKPSFGASAHLGVDLHPTFFIGLSYMLNVNGKRSYDLPTTGVETTDLDSNTVHTIRTNLGIRISPQTLLLAQWNEDVGGSAISTRGRFFGIRLSHVFFTPAVRPAGREPITDPAARPSTPPPPPPPT